MVNPLSVVHIFWYKQVVIVFICRYGGWLIWYTGRRKRCWQSWTSSSLTYWHVPLDPSQNLDKLDHLKKKKKCQYLICQLQQFPFYEKRKIGIGGKRKRRGKLVGIYNLFLFDSVVTYCSFMESMMFNLLGNLAYWFLFL